MMDQKKLFEILRDYVVSWKVEILIGLILFCVDVSLSQPLYRDVLDLKEFAPFLSVGMAVLFTVLARVCARLLARGNFWLFVMGIFLFLCLMVFIYIGQEAAAEMQANDPFAFLSDAEPAPKQFNRHYIAVGLTVALFSISVFIGYLVAQGDEAGKASKKELYMSTLARWLQSKITILQGVYDRALAKPITIAEERVNSRLGKLENNITKYQRTDQQLKGELNYQLQLLELIHKQRISAIQAVYAKKSFFKSLKSFFS